MESYEMGGVLLQYRHAIPLYGTRKANKIQGHRRGRSGSA